jgi:dipeptidase E
MSKDLDSSSEFLYYEEVKEKMDGLGIVNFYIRPHLNSEYFPKVREENLKDDSLRLDRDCYALDDDSAVLVVDGKIEVVSAGKWVKYDGKKEG